MAVKTTIRTPMPVKMRAKQFAMFDAMKGLTEAIAEKEKQYCPKRELTENRIEEINEQLSVLEVGESIKVIYYCQYTKGYCHRTGTIKRIDMYWKELQVDDVSISFSEIYNLNEVIA